MLPLPNQMPGVQLPAGQLSIANAANSTAWKNRCSERRDRINAQNMQIALEKEFQVKEKLIEENNNLKHESDLRQHKITDLHAQIEKLNKEIYNNQSEIKTLKDDLSNHQQQIINSPSSSSHQINPNVYGTVSSNSMSSLSSNTTSKHDPVKLINITNSSTGPNPNTNNPLNRHPSSVSANSSTIYSLPPNEVPDENSEPVNKQANIQTKPQQTNLAAVPPINGHKFEVITFNTIERCEYCCGILYGICRQAVRCQHKQCKFLCHPKCRQYLPANCPININQRVQLKGVDFARGIGTLMVGLLKVPKLGGVKKGWIEHHVYLSNARLFVCPIIDSKPSIIPSQIIDIKDPNFAVSKVNETDVIHASKKDIPCILKMVVSKLKNQHQVQPLLFCAKDEKDRNSWINVLRDLNERLIQAHKVSECSLPLLPVEAKEICDANSIRNAAAACVFDLERILIASDEGMVLNG